MADKNFARSGTADTDLLADDDPLSELARLVNFEPRPVQGVDRSFAEGAQPAPRYENPVLALEDELLRAFEQYDAPSSYVAVEPVVAERAAPLHVEPVFEAPAPVAQEQAFVIDEAPMRGFSADGPYHHEPAFADVPSFDPAPETAADPALLLADELETSIHDVPSVEVEPVIHAGHAFADRFEPRFEEPVRQDVAVEPHFSEPVLAAEPQPTFLGLQPLAADAGFADEIGLDLERELELSIGDGFADDLLADASFVEPLPVAVAAVETNIEPSFDSWMPVEASIAQAEPFHAEPAAYAGEEPQFVADIAHETREERARSAAEAEAAWQVQASEPVFEAEPVYQVESVEKGESYDHDDLLAEIESFPVPEARSPLAAATVAAAAAVTARGNTPANISAIFGRATPRVHREPVVETVAAPVVEPVIAPVQAVQTPVVEARREPVVAAAPVAEPELDFENMEFDLSDIDLDLSDFTLDEGAATPAVKPVEAKVSVVPQPVAVETPVRREPAVAVPVSTYTKPQPVAVETNDGALPFDPTMIAETDVGVSPVTELDVPQLPVIEKEKPPVYQPDYDLDIDAEMAQLFSEPVAKPRAEDLPVRAAVAAASAAVAQPVTQINDVDDFERALEEDFRRSLNQPERMAIPVDPGQANVLYAGDGYDDEAARPRRGLLIAASIAGLLLVGGTGVYAWSAFTGGSASSGEPRVILADKDPIKVVPAEKGGKTVPNQDKAVYDRVAGDTANAPQQEQLVTSTEEPVDVVQRTLTPETLPFDGPEDGPDTADAADDQSRLLPGVDEPETASSEAAGKPVVSPRKVKTMIVKPDGTLVAREDTVAAPAEETADLDAKATATTGSASGGATANAVIDADASLRAEQTAGGQPRSALAEVADTQVDDAAPVRTVKTTTIGADGTAAKGDKAPVPGTRPVDQPVNVVETVTENGNIAAKQTAAATQTQKTAEQTEVAAVAPGSYVIQIASLPSEAEAQKTYKSLSSKFSGVIGGRGVDIKKAEIPNKGTFFRIRIPAGSREEANALCSRYKSAGGSCLVTR
ncbi:SPOR domain-containing protein [Shinella zoogloeoides]|uniref:SPOR domain-containing protein n=1 Tax=Shinella zoogloeoides TaxID=352475 RepID=A0A6N8TD91_SHIZO|nr:SPOR domain-containing protein [Shinella zoogloeoides]MXN99183.1 SPOR domain-containing protein [Shinella zoogloeoides]UEX83030.1 SPOR domain-containing protein [Shinella zoogloeoides]